MILYLDPVKILGVNSLIKIKAYKFGNQGNECEQNQDVLKTILFNLVRLGNPIFKPKIKFINLVLIY